MTRLRSRPAPSDLLRESVGGLRTHIARTLLTIVVAVIGTGALVGTIGITMASRWRVQQQFSALQSTEITVSSPIDAAGNLPFSLNADREVDAIPGVVAGGVLWSISLSNVGVTRLSPAIFPGKGSSVEASAASVGLFSAVGATFDHGSEPTPDEWTQSSGVVIGIRAAMAIGLSRDSVGSAVYLDGVPLEVEAVMTGVTAEPELLSQVIVPYNVVVRLWGLPTNGASVVVRARPGAASVVAPEAKLELDPSGEKNLVVAGGTSSLQIQSEVGSDLSSLVLIVGAIALLVSIFSIGGAMLVSVSERTSEIGLRRALGARRSHIAVQFILESSILGVVGGILGGYVGVVGVVADLNLRNEAALVTPTMLACGPLIGATIGLLAGAYPAIRASKLHPITALRR